MDLLESIALVCSLASFAGALVQLVAGLPGNWLIEQIRRDAWAELALPIAMLGATAGIALGLLGQGLLWTTGGFSLLALGPLDASLIQVFADARGTARPTHVRVPTARHVTAVVASAAGFGCFVAA